MYCTLYRIIDLYLAEADLRVLGSFFLLLNFSPFTVYMYCTFPEIFILTRSFFSHKTP